MQYIKRSAAKCIFKEDFINSDFVRDNRGTLVGSPVVANGITLDGSTQYATFTTNRINLTNKLNLTFEMWFTPTFAADDGVSHYWFDTTVGGGKCAFFKAASNNISLTIGNTALTAIAYATYSPYWLVNKRNTFTFCATSASTLVYLNNNLIGTLATAWALTAQPASLSIGASIGGSFHFAGTIHSFSIYDTKWSAGEVADAFNKQTFTEIAFEKAALYLPCKSIYANTGDGTALGADMDMETVGTAAWSEVTVTLSKEAGTRTGGSGSQILRLTRNGGNPQAYQILLTANKYYRTTGWARGDGTNTPRVYFGNAIAWTGTSSATWQYFDITAQATVSTGFALMGVVAAAGYVDFDDVTLQEVDFLTENKGTGADVKIGDSGLYGVTQATYNGFVYDGTNSYLDCGSDVVGTSAGTFGVLFQYTVVGAEAQSGAIFHNGKLILALNSATRLAFTSDGGGTAIFSASNIIVPGAWYSVIVTRTLAGVINFYINGELSGTADQASGTPEGGTTNLCIGNAIDKTRTWGGTIKYPFVLLDTIATSTQCRELHNQLMQQLNQG